MAIKLVREFQQKQQVAITPQLKKSIDLLQLSRVEIINKIHAEAEDNPFLIKELKEDVSFDHYNNNDGLLSNLAEIVTLQNSLESQVNDLNLSKSQQEIAMTLIQSLDESGLLPLNNEELEELFNHRIQVDKILNVLIGIIHNLEPAGIGARDFKELILLQLKRKNLAQSQLKLIKEIEKEIYGKHLPYFDKYISNLEHNGFELVFSEDMSNSWTDFTKERIKQYNSEKERNIRVHGIEVVDSLNSFYNFVGQYFSNGKLGGIRVLAKKT